MPDMERLSAIIEDSGMTITAIASKAGITRTTLYSRLNGIGDWKVKEMKGITKVLRLTKAERDEIFLQ